MKKVLHGISAFFLAVIAILVVVYCLLGFYYKGGFPCFTWVNGVYCTGKSVSEVNEELILKSPYEGIVVMDKDDSRIFVSASDVGYTRDYTDALNRIFYNNEPFLWGLHVFENISHEYNPQVTLDTERLSGIISGWEIFDEPEDTKCVLEMKPGEGYVLQNAVNMTPVRDRIIDRVYRSMLEGREVVDLREYEECYIEQEMSTAEKERASLYEKLAKLQDFDVTYDFCGDSVRLSKAVAGGFFLTLGDYDKAAKEDVNADNGSGMFIVGGKETTIPEGDKVYSVSNILVDDEGNPIISEKRIYDFLASAVEDHSTSWMMKRYKNGLTSEVSLMMGKRGNGGIYDVSAEFANIRDCLINKGEGLKGTRQIPLLENALTVDAKEKLGDTFIEVDMGQQKLSYYVEGKLSMEMPVVTGNINRGRGTPAGVYSVYNNNFLK